MCVLCVHSRRSEEHLTAFVVVASASSARSGTRVDRSIDRSVGESEKELARATFPVVRVVLRSHLHKTIDDNAPHELTSIDPNLFDCLRRC